MLRPRGSPLDRLVLVTAEVVEDHDVARLQRGDEDLLHIEAEQLAVDRAINDPWRVDPIVAQERRERSSSSNDHTAPLPRSFDPACSIPEGTPYWSSPQVSSMKTRRLGSRIRPRRGFSSAPACGRCPAGLARLAERFFLKLRPSPRTKVQTVR